MRGGSRDIGHKKGGGEGDSALSCCWSEELSTWKGQTSSSNEKGKL